MVKKLISMVIVITVLATMAIVPVSAASSENKVLSSSQTAAAIDTAISAILGLDESADIRLSEDFADTLTENGNTAAAISSTVAEYAYIERSKADDIADRIIEESTFYVVHGPEKTLSVYVAVDISKNPELYDEDVFLSAVDKMIDKCNEVAIESGVDTTADNYKPMSYSYLAGELALHMILSDVLAKAGAGSWNPTLDDVYNQAIYADLSVFEDRVPTIFTELFGKLIIFLLSVIN